jgi:hypothetical protein
MIAGVAILPSSRWPPSLFSSFSPTGRSPPWITAEDFSVALTRAAATAWTTLAPQGNAAPDRWVLSPRLVGQKVSSPRAPTYDVRRRVPQCPVSARSCRSASEWGTAGIRPLATSVAAIGDVRLTSIALKNPQNAPAPNSSIWAATLGISADCAPKARRTVTDERLSANAGSPAKISQRVSVASTIVIESKIRVFQHNPSTPAVRNAPIPAIHLGLANRSKRPIAEFGRKSFR